MPSCNYASSYKIVIREFPDALKKYLREVKLPSFHIVYAHSTEGYVQRKKGENIGRQFLIRICNGRAENTLMFAVAEVQVLTESSDDGGTERSAALALDIRWRSTMS